MQTETYNAQNHLSSGLVGYDAAGDIISDVSNQYVYDAEGRLCAVQNRLFGGWTGYLYDAAGNRVAKGTLSSSVTASNACNMSSNGFTQTAGYVVGPSGEQLTEVDAGNNWVHTNAYAGGKLIGTYDAKGLHLYVDDPLGTRRAQVNDATGAVEATYQSLPFGDGYTPNFATGTDDPTENHFTGKERDSESGNDYFGARYYASSMGRFMSPDWGAEAEPVPYADLEDPQSLNLYAYVENNPLRSRDADGHHQECAPDTSSVDKNGTMTVTAGACHEVPDPILPTLFSFAVGHHWFNQKMIKTWDPESLSARLANKATTGPLPDPKPNLNDALQRANNREVTKIVSDYLKSTGKTAEDLTAKDWKILAERVDKAEGVVGDFNERMMNANPGVRTAEQAVEKAAGEIGVAAEAGAAEVEEVCGGPCPIP